MSGILFAVCSKKTNTNMKRGNLALAKSSFERAIEKQQKEAKRLAEQQARREKAHAIVSGQPIINGMRILDPAAEEILNVILSAYDGNEQRRVHNSYDIIPQPYHNSLSLEFEKLSMYGAISSPHVWIDASWEVTLTPQGITYFEDKERIMASMESSSSNFEKISTRKKYDVFISHANRDKSEYVDSLYTSIRRLGVNIFYDSDVISWGDNWKQVILNGTDQSEFAIIVISENFFDREWTERELNEFLKRQNETGQKIVLPLIHGITLDLLKEKYPTLGDIQVVDTSRCSKEEITILFAKELIKRIR